jgi:hypothetical protein
MEFCLHKKAKYKETSEGVVGPTPSEVDAAVRFLV